MRIWWVVLLLASACSTAGGSFRFTGSGMREAFESWKRTATPKTRSTIEALDEDPSILIHIIRGHIDEDSRGGASVFAGSKQAHQQCTLHPVAPGVRWSRNFDVIYDEEQQRRMAEARHLATPIEAILQHEIMGHIVPLLIHPELMNAPFEVLEREAVRQENEYRLHVGLPPVPEPAKSKRP
jgi:hypothetical protein